MNWIDQDYNLNYYKNMKKQGLLVMLTLAILVTGKLEVINFSSLGQQFFDPELADIPYSIANFGFAPFGKTMIANLRESPGLSNECQTNINESYSRQYQNSFMLIPRGDCPFVEKTLHAQEVGAAMAIIMDDQQHERGVIMKDNGFGYKVNIPAIFINHKMGQKLVNLINQTENKVVLKIAFENLKKDTVDVNFYLQAMNPMAYKFVEEFAPYYDKISKFINLKLVYEQITCKACDVNMDCEYGGTYCSINYQHNKSATGKDVLRQQLRETVMFEKYRKNWWKYMLCIKNECAVITELEQCSNKCITKKLKMDATAFNNEVANTFHFGGDNPYLKQQLDILQSSGIEVFPSVTLNSIKMKGSLKAQFVFDDICNSLTSPPSACNSYTAVDQRIKNRTVMYWFTVFFVILVGAALFMGLFVFCRRKMRKKMTFEMQGRVDDMVSKYIEFYSERNNNK